LKQSYTVLYERKLPSGFVNTYPVFFHALPALDLPESVGENDVPEMEGLFGGRTAVAKTTKSCRQYREGYSK